MILAWIRTHLIPFALIVLVVIVGCIAVYWEWEARQTAKTRVELSRNQTGAAIESGRDAVNVVGNRAATEATIDQQTRTNDADIRQVPGASAAVSPSDRDAFLRILCRGAGHRSDPKCVQLANTR